ncbi:MAG: sulfur oxidation c-type cytochrome SoxA [Ectothiorhodospiraceae bacterium]|nr:sulfur oxidation c-type cytochrome SoxA [Ectothiorhodospiraceae bacterium]
MSPALRAMQDDDVANPGMLWVLDGEALWSTRAGAADRACADCHGDAAESMRGVAARHPTFDPRSAAPIALDQRIERCRVEQQGAAPSAPESHDRLALTAFVAHQSRGLALGPFDDPRLRPFVDAGRASFHQRQGQLDLSCADCHDRHPGRRLAGNVIPEGHPTGYPIYRLEWQTVGSLDRRLRGCLAGMRATVPAPGAPELTELAAYLAWRARGMTIETPAVRP